MCVGMRMFVDMVADGPVKASLAFLMFSLTVLGWYIGLGPPIAPRIGFEVMTFCDGGLS
jgi:hypothetical protein